MNKPAGMSATLVTVLIGVLLAAGTVPAQEPDAKPGPASALKATGPAIYPILAAGLVDLDVPIIDVRSAEEVAETGMVAGAVNIPHSEVERIAEFIGEDRSRTVVVYCRSGRRAELVVDALRERGYHGLVNAGGREDLLAALAR